MWSLRFAVVLLLTEYGNAATDPNLYFVKQVTTNGGASKPMFLDKRHLYFTGRYGSTCDHIYRLDLENIADGPSLVSAGIGRERIAAINLGAGKREGTELWISSTARRSLDDYQRTRELDVASKFTESRYCPKDKCAEATSAEIRAACDKPHILRDDNTDAIRIYPTGRAIGRRNITQVTAKWTNAGPLVDNIFAHSAQCDLGECILVNDQVGPKNRSAEFQRVNSETRWSDGFAIFRRKQKSTESQSYKLYYSGAAGPVDEPTRNGVHNLNGAKLYTLDITADSDGQYRPGAEFVLYQSAQYDYLWPSSNDFQTLQFVATRIERATGRRVIVMVYLDPEPSRSVSSEKVLTDPNVNSWQATMHPNDLHLTFISDRNGKDDVYIAKLVEKDGDWSDEKTTASILRLSSADITTTMKLIEGGKYEIGLFRRVRVYDNREALIETTTGIFHLHIQPNASRILRRVSSGLNDFESPNFLDKDTFLYAGSLKPRHEITQRAEEPIPTELSELLSKAKNVRSLPKDSELFKTNQYGIITEQMTANDYYEGEPRTSPDSKWMVFSRWDSDYDWWKQRFGEEAQKLKIAESKGFEFDAAFSSDAQWLLYAAYRPKTDTEIKNYDGLMKYHYVDIPRSSIYLYDFGSETEKLLYDCKDTYCWQPSFYSENKKVLFLWLDPSKQSSRFISFDIGPNFSAVNITQFDEISQNVNFGYALVNTAQHSTNTNTKSVIVFGDSDGISFGQFNDRVDQPTTTTASFGRRVCGSFLLVLLLYSVFL